MTQIKKKHTWKMPMVQGNMSNPLILVFAGPNGSGKSTVTKLIPQYGTYINADNLKVEYALTDLEAAQKAESLRNKLLEKKSDFTFETVLSTDRNLHLLQNAKKIGYQVHCIYVLTCNADINIARIKSRVQEGGHDVPEEKVRSRYTKALKLLPKLIDVCDIILVYDNSVMPSLIFKKDKDRIEYYPSEFWSIEKLKELIQ